MLVVNQLCPNCGQACYVRGKETWLLGRLEGANPAPDKAFPLTVVSCEVCGFIQMFDQRIVGEPQPSYPDDWSVRNRAGRRVAVRWLDGPSRFSSQSDAQQCLSQMPKTACF